MTAVNGSPPSGGCICFYGVKAFKDEGDIQQISFFSTSKLPAHNSTLIVLQMQADFPLAMLYIFFHDSW